MRLTYVGHATVSIELAGSRFLTDPILRSRVAFLRWRAPAQPVTVAATSAVLISHLHHDHCDLPSLALLGRDRTMVVPAGSERLFRRRGFTAVVGMRKGQSIQLGDVTVNATEAAHDGRRFPFGPHPEALGYVLDGDGTRVYFAGDTDLFPGMRDIGGRLDVALLPVWGWGPSVGSGHLDPISAAEAVAMLMPSLAVPIHWGTLRPLWHRAPPEREPAHIFAADVARRGLPTEVVILDAGRSVTWPRSV